MQYLILFREPDGRQDAHSPDAVALHRQRWAQWMEPLVQQNKLAGGKSLSAEGRVIKGKDQPVSDCPHTVGTEIVGGYLILHAENMEEATAMMQDCPIFEFGGYVEIRPVM